MFISPIFVFQVIETVNGRSSYTLTRLQNISSHHHSISPTTQLDGMSSYMSHPYMDGIEPIIRGSTPQQQQQQPPQQPQLPMFKEVKEERLSPLLTSCPASQPAPSYHQHMMNHHQQQQQQQQQSTTSSLLNTANHVVGHLLYNSLPQDLDLEPTLFNSGLECDVDQVLRHELSVEGNLDFNFENSGMNGSSSNSQRHQPPITSTRSWVH